LAGDLRRFLKGEAIRARPMGRVERLGRWCRRNPALAVSGSFAAAALPGGSTLSTLFAVVQARSTEALRREQKAM
jgi:serine/threonine-protein kinase